MQQYLSEREYQNVTVYCMDGQYRNNVGGWLIHSVAGPANTKHDFQYYATKDKAMIDDASHGLVLWDAKSKGTLNSVMNLITQRKPAVVYFGPSKAFVTVRSKQDLSELIARCDAGSIARLQRDLSIRQFFFEPQEATSARMFFKDSGERSS